MNDKRKLDLFLIALAIAVIFIYANRAYSAELYAEGGLAYQFRHGACMNAAGQKGWCTWDRNSYDSGIGHIEFGVIKQTGRLTGSLYARHESLPMCRDFGVNQLGVQVRVRLWGNP